MSWFRLVWSSLLLYYYHLTEAGCFSHLSFTFSQLFLCSLCFMDSRSQQVLQLTTGWWWSVWCGLPFVAGSLLYVTYTKNEQHTDL